MPEASEGAALFAANCAGCHGAQAEGSARAPALTRLTSASGAFPTAAVLSQIDGYTRNPRDQMPEFGALLTGELVPVDVDGVLTPTPRPLAALLAYLESVQQN